MRRTFWTAVCATGIATLCAAPLAHATTAPCDKKTKSCQTPCQTREKASKECAIAAIQEQAQELARIGELAAREGQVAAQRAVQEMIDSGELQRITESAVREARHAMLAFTEGQQCAEGEQQPIGALVGHFARDVAEDVLTSLNYEHQAPQAFSQEVAQLHRVSNQERSNEAEALHRELQLERQHIEKQKRELEREREKLMRRIQQLEDELDRAHHGAVTAPVVPHPAHAPEPLHVSTLRAPKAVHAPKALHTPNSWVATTPSRSTTTTTTTSVKCDDGSLFVLDGDGDSQILTVGGGTGGGVIRVDKKNGQVSINGKDISISEGQSGAHVVEVDGTAVHVLGDGDARVLSVDASDGVVKLVDGDGNTRLLTGNGQSKKVRFPYKTQYTIRTNSETGNSHEAEDAHDVFVEAGDLHQDIAVQIRELMNEMNSQVESLRSDMRDLRHEMQNMKRDSD
jgi:hypothetical protein